MRLLPNQFNIYLLSEQGNKLILFGDPLSTGLESLSKPPPHLPHQHANLVVYILSWWYCRKTLRDYHSYISLNTKHLLKGTITKTVSLSSANKFMLKHWKSFSEICVCPVLYWSSIYWTYVYIYMYIHVCMCMNICYTSYSVNINYNFFCDPI